MLVHLRRRTVKSAEDAETKAQIERVHDITTVLNGLERIAVGCRSGLYDLAEIDSLGGTIIRRTFEQYESFIKVSRTGGRSGEASSRGLTLLLRFSTTH